MDNKLQVNEDYLRVVMDHYGIKSHEYNVRDFGLTGNETTAEIEQWVMDFISDYHTECAETKHAARWEDDYFDEELNPPLS